MHRSHAVVLVPVLALALALGGAAPGASVVAQDLVLENGNVVDVVAGEVISDATIEVLDGRIAGIVRDGDGPDAGIERIDLGGRYVVPGLMDAHVHIADEEQAVRALRSGVTTARSAGVSHYADVGLGALIADGWARGPEILAAGYHVRPAMSDDFFLDNPDLGRLRGTPVEGLDGIRSVVRANLERGVSFIKTVATERAGLPGTDPRVQVYEVEQLAAAVEAAQAAAVPVMTHAHGEEGVRAAVDAGVRSIEHGTYMTPATIRLMAERNIFYVPTVAIVTDLARPGGDYDDAALQIRGRHMLTRVRETARQAHEVGVSIVASTDSGYGPESTTRLSHELLEFVEHVGMSPVEALRSATTVAAELFGIGHRTGRIAEGYEADLVVVERNPLEEIATLEDVLLVVSDGRVEVRRGDW